MPFMKKLFNRSFLFFLPVFCMCTNISFAQKTMRGRIVDYFTNQAVPDSSMLLLLLDQDSVVLDTCFVGKSIDPKTNRVVTNYFCTIPKEGNYFLKCSHPNYNTAVVPFQAKFYKREEYIDGHDIRLKRSIKNGVDLPEVKVTATKLKFYFRGDTLVYNADAFITQYGFVLDDLLKKMPGITVESGYQIYSNGRKIDELLLNGKDFFNNDRESLIENLPAYMIKKIQVYEHDDSLGLHKKLNKRPPLAMDVRLKVEYHSAFLGNMDMGAGTDGRYFGRLFGMRIHDLYRLTFFAGSNNINRNEEADKNGQLYNMDNGTGNKKFHVSGFSYNVESPSDIYSLSGKFRIQGSKEVGQLYKVEKQFYGNGDVYSFTDEKSIARNFSVQTSHTVDLFRYKPYSLRISPSFVFIHTKNYVDRAFLNANSNLADDFGKDLVDSLRKKPLGQKMCLYGISRTLSEQSLPKDILQASLALTQDYRIPHTEDLFSFELSGAYSGQKSKMFDKFELNRLGMSNSDGADTWKNLYQKYDNKNWRWGFSPSYLLALNAKNALTFKVQYLHSLLSIDKFSYDLASIDGWGADTQYALGMLPSQIELMKVLNTTNSHSYTEKDDFWTLETSYSLSFKGKSLSMALPVKIQRKSLSFYQENNDQDIRRRMNTLDFNLKFDKYMIGQTGYSYSLAFSVANSMPDAFNFVNQRSDIYGILVTKGNPNLKNSTNFVFKSNVAFTPKLMQNHYLFLSYYYNINQVATAVELDKKTGIYTYTPANIDGNQALTANMINAFYLDRNYKQKLKNDISFYYIKSADYSGVNLAEMANKSVIHNIVISEKLEYSVASRNTKYRGSISPFINYQHSASKRVNFQPINAWDYGLSASAYIELPGSCRFNSEIQGTCRRGYNDNSMNVEEVIWNMGLVKTFKNNMSISLNVADLLGQRSNYYRLVTAQATVECVRDMLRRYVMLHFIWQFSRKRTNK